MLSAEAVRLVAIELLSPTAANETGSGFPTVAGKRVFDSRSAAVTDLDLGKPYTPVISLYTRRASTVLRGSMTDAEDSEATTFLDVVAELAIVDRDPERAQYGLDPEYVDAMADGDEAARLVLAALAAQVRFVLTRSSAGWVWRQLVRQVLRIDVDTHAVPEMGLRYQRMMLSFELSISDDWFNLDDGGLPEPLRSVHAALPAASYAKAKLTELAGYFSAETPPPLATIKGSANLGGEEITIGVGTPDPEG